MRIVGGEFSGRQIKTPEKGKDIRPTSDKVRQAVFNMLEARGLVDGASVLDAFCGTGALGLEALSRGAAFCSFWDHSPTSLNIAKENAALLNVEKRCNFLKINSCDAKTRRDLEPPADLVFLDPPYNRSLVPLVIAALIKKNWISENPTFVIEVSKPEMVTMPELEIVQDKLYGDTKILIAHLAGAK